MKQFDFLKKTILCGALWLVGMSANAQGTYAVDSLEKITVGEDITSVPNITMTYGGDATQKDAYAVGKSKFTDGTETSAVFYAYCKGNGNNPKDANGTGFDKGGGLPVKGTYYVFKPVTNGSLKVAVVLNSGKPFYVIEDGVALSNYSGITVTEKYMGTYTFDVKGGSTYYVLCTGSKLGLGGFVYTIDPAHVTSVAADVKANAPIYNIAGQQVSKAVKGVYIQNGKKYMVK
jgi:hypothetical protein